MKVWCGTKKNDRQTKLRTFKNKHPPIPNKYYPPGSSEWPFQEFKWPFQGLSDLHLRNQKGTWKKLVVFSSQEKKYFCNKFTIHVIVSNESTSNTGRWASGPSKLVQSSYRTRWHSWQAKAVPYRYYHMVFHPNKNAQINPRVTSGQSNTSSSQIIQTSMSRCLKIDQTSND